MVECGAVGVGPGEGWVNFAAAELAAPFVADEDSCAGDWFVRCHSFHCATCRCRVGDLVGVGLCPFLGELLFEFGFAGWCWADSMVGGSAYE